MKKHIHILKMGGTIEFRDPAYEKMNDLMKLDITVESYLENMIQPHFSYDTHNICDKDSRDITIEDLENAWNTITELKGENILITHGTFTMVNSARFMEKYLANDNPSKKIIFTGSMIPVVGFSKSDAAFNVGYSMAIFDYVEPGVYICMNGGTFKTGDIEKNPELLRFE